MPLLLRRLAPMVNSHVRDHTLSLLSLVDPDAGYTRHDSAQFQLLPWVLRRVLSQAFLSASHRHVWALAAFAMKALGASKDAWRLFRPAMVAPPVTLQEASALVEGCVAQARAERLF